MKITKLFFTVLIILMSVACTTAFKENNELALPPFFKEEYLKIKKNKK